MLRLASTLFLATLTAGLLGACTTSSHPDSTLTVENDESFAITDLYVDAVGDETFSDNLLAGAPLQPGDAIKLAITCDTYDVEIVDEAGGDCVVHDADLCFTDADWVIDDNFCTFSQSRQDKTPVPPVQSPHTASRR